MIVGCAAEDRLSERNAELAPIPASWISVESRCGYRFEAPPDVTFQDVQGEDSCVDAWTTNGCVNGGDFGSFSSALTEYEEYADYEATTEIIAGFPAKVVTAISTEGLLAAVHLPNVDGGALTVWAQCTDSTARENALRSFRSITFEH